MRDYPDREENSIKMMRELLVIGFVVMQLNFSGTKKPTLISR